MRPETWRWLAVAFRGTLAFFGASAGVLVAAKETKFVQGLPDKLFYGVIVISALLGFVNGATGAWRYARAPGRSQAQARVQKALATLLVQVSEEQGVPLKYLGASAFVPGVRWARRDGSWRWRRHVLVRVMRFRLDDSPQPTAVFWEKDKGAVGKCWATSREAHCDWHEQAANHSASALSLADFKAIPEKLRDGFTHQEFVAIAQKYSEILAVPVLSDAGVVVGVISVDIATRAQEPRTVLKSMGDAADAAAVIIRKDLERLYPLA